MKAKPLPFVVERNAPVPLSTQIADGVVRAIGAGYYREGDRLPSLDEMSDRLSVARQTVRVAVGNLVRRGVVVARRKSGIVVLDPGGKTFTTHVLHLRRGGASYYFSAKNARLSERLSGGRIRLSVIDLSSDEWRSGMPQVKAVLDGNRVDLAVIDGVTDVVGELCRAHGVPYLDVGREIDPGAVATVLIDSQKPLADLVAHARKQGIRSVQVVGLHPGAAPTIAAFRKAGIEAGLLEVSLEKQIDGPEVFEKAGYEAVKTVVAHPESLSDLMHFSDDYIARGGLMALAEAGIKVPGQLRVSTLSNRGYCPVFPVSLTRLETDPVAVGDRIADLVMDLLRRGRKPRDTVIVRAELIAGRSL